MRQYGFLERTADLTVGDVLRRKADAGEIPPLVTVETHARVRDAIALLHEHRVSQLPVVSAQRPVHGRRLDRRARPAAPRRRGPGAARRGDRRRDGAAVPGRRRRSDPVREAVELLVGDQQALLVTVDGRAAGIVTRADLLEALARELRASRTRAVHAGLTPDPSLRVGHPRDPPDLDLRAARARRVRRGLRLLALGQPDARGARDGARRARGRPRRRVLVGHGGRARGDHRRLRGGRARRAARRPLRRHLPARRQGAHALGPASTTWSTRPTSTRSSAPCGPRRG